jgi:hypothetical protein
MFKARQDNLLVEAIGDELVVYDEARHRAHRLNRIAGLVWRHCDGRHTVADLAALLQREVNAAATEDVVWLTLDRLDAARLLEEGPPLPEEDAMTSRRRLLKKILIGALAVLTPVVVTLAVPTPAQAQGSGIIG